MKIIWIEEAYPSAVEGLLFDNADESDEDEVDEYFRDYSMSDEHDWNSNDIYLDHFCSCLTS